MSARNSPTARRRTLGIQLRRYRDNASIKQQVAANALGCGNDKIIRIEKGESGVGKADLEVLLNLYEVGDPKVRDWLHEIARESRQRGWWVRYQPDTATGVYVGFETASTELELWTNMVLPGLFQTPAYARAVIARTNPAATTDQIDRSINLRVERQNRLGKRSLTVWAIIDEPVLSRPYPGDAHMRVQLERLLDMSELPNVKIQICPTSPAPPIVKPPFSLLTLDDGDRLVHAENLIGDTVADDPPAVKAADELFKLLRSASLSMEASRDRIRQAAIAAGGSNGPQRDLANEQLQQPGVMRSSADNSGTRWRSGASTAGNSNPGL